MKNFEEIHDDHFCLGPNRPTLKKCLLSDVGAENIYYNEQHFVIIQELVQILKPLELAVKELSKNDANLLTSTFPCSKKLGEMDSEIGNEMLVAIRTPQQRYVVAHEVFTELLHIPVLYFFFLILFFRYFLIKFQCKMLNDNTDE
jgi:hypothetical protein